MDNYDEIILELDKTGCNPFPFRSIDSHQTVSTISNFANNQIFASRSNDSRPKHIYVVTKKYKLLWDKSLDLVNILFGKKDNEWTDKIKDLTTFHDIIKNTNIEIVCPTWLKVASQSYKKKRQHSIKNYSNVLLIFTDARTVLTPFELPFGAVWHPLPPLFASFG